MDPTGFQETYEQLAERYERQHDARQRDIFLVLAADAALVAGSPQDAERLRLRLLDKNPHHLLRPFASFGDALTSQDIQDYVADLRQRFPPEIAAKLAGEPSPNGAPPLAAAPFPATPAPTPMPAPRPSGLVSTSGARREDNSPYARYEAPPPPPAAGSDAWGRLISLLLYFIVLFLSVAAAAYVLARPFMADLR